MPHSSLPNPLLIFHAPPRECLFVARLACIAGKPTCRIEIRIEVLLCARSLGGGPAAAKYIARRRPYRQNEQEKKKPVDVRPVEGSPPPSPVQERGRRKRLDYATAAGPRATGALGQLQAGAVCQILRLSLPPRECASAFLSFCAFAVLLRCIQRIREGSVSSVVELCVM